MTTTDAIIRIEAVNKWYGAFQVLTGIDLAVRAGERIVICGPSGSGKSTLIRCINRLEAVQKGRIVVDGIELTGGGRNVDAVRREVGMVFQQFNLFPHLTVLENCMLAPMRSRKVGKAEAEATAMKMTRSATALAKPISCVTHSMVMPSSARPIMVSSTSLTISGSSAEVGSSNSMIFGAMHSARAMATRCCWPPDSCAGCLCACSGDRKSTRLNSSHSDRSRMPSSA